ncbi:MAG TPA: glycosyltransferase, partial [Bryobacteraceae bacterium]|nr:glycosyltransferase [Bryobacteraceae bacterium]
GMLEQAVQSILRQSHRDFEFLILDDGGSDEGTRACLEKAACTHSRVRLCSEPHRGLTATLNRGIALARGELIARQDADDWSDPARLERQAAFLDAHPAAALVGSAAWTHQHDGSPLWPVRMPETNAAILDAFWRGNPFVHGSVMFRKQAAGQAGGYREELPCSQDYDFFWRLAELAEAANLPDPLYHYRYTAGSVSASRAAEQARAHRAARRLALSRRAGVAESPAAALAEAGSDTVRNTFRAALKQADHLMLAGDYTRAAKAYRDLLRSHPLSGLAWAKLARLAVFCLAPPAREMCFR